MFSHMQPSDQSFTMFISIVLFPPFMSKINIEMAGFNAKRKCYGRRVLSETEFK